METHFPHGSREKMHPPAVVLPPGMCYDKNDGYHAKNKDVTSLTTKQIECFLSVANSLNFTHSAQALYASQSTVSRQISLMEEELGFPLFLRQKGEVQLTPAGQVMLDHFRENRLRFEQSKEIAVSLTKGRDGCLRIGFYCNMLIENFGFSTLNDFRSRYPDISLSFECMPTGDPETNIRDKKFDLAFIHDFDELNPADFTRRTVYRTNRHLLYGATHPLAHKQDLHFSDFANETFWRVSNRTSQRHRESIDTVFRYFGLENTPVRTANNIETVLLNIRLGNGFTFLDPVTHELNNKYYKSLLLPEEISRVNIEVAWLNSNLNPVLPLFLQHLFPQ